MLNNHNHRGDRIIKTCPFCITAIKEYQESAKQLNETGTWHIPKKILPNIHYKIWIPNNK